MGDKEGISCWTEDDTWLQATLARIFGPLPGKSLPAIDSTSTDLSSTFRHAGRKTISTDDVLLLTRRNEDLAKVLRNCLKR